MLHGDFCSERFGDGDTSGLYLDEVRSYYYFTSQLRVILLLYFIYLNSNAFPFLVILAFLMEAGKHSAALFFWGGGGGGWVSVFMSWSGIEILAFQQYDYRSCLNFDHILQSWMLLGSRNVIDFCPLRQDFILFYNLNLFNWKHLFTEHDIVFSFLFLSFGNGMLPSSAASFSLPPCLSVLKLLMF